MYDAGIANLESSDSKVHDNVFKNVKYGIRISLGGQNNEIYNNTFDNCSQCKRYSCSHLERSGMSPHCLISEYGAYMMEWLALRLWIMVS